MKRETESNRASPAVIGVDSARKFFHLVGFGVDGKIAFPKEDRDHDRAWSRSHRHAE